MIREAAEKTGEAVGDGTSTSTLLAHAIFAEGVRNVTAGASAVDIKRGLDRGLAVALEAIKRISRPVSSRKEKEQVAAISAHNDTVIGKLVADAMEKVGPEGAITVEEARTTETTLEVVEGMQFDRGYLSPYFITDSERMECVLENAKVLLYEKKISNMKDLLPILEQVAKAPRNFEVQARNPANNVHIGDNNMVFSSVYGPPFVRQGDAILARIREITDKPVDDANDLRGYHFKRLLGGRWHVEVVDNGVGISPDDRDKIFEPFHSTRPEGFGLGRVEVLFGELLDRLLDLDLVRVTMDRERVLVAGLGIAVTEGRDVDRLLADDGSQDDVGGGQGAHA